MTASADWPGVPAASRLLHLPVWPLALFSLWDFYIAGMRPLDHLTVMMVVCFLALSLNREIHAERMLKMLLLLALVWVMGLRSSFLFADAWRSGSGLFEGAILAVMVAASSWRGETVLRLLKFLIIVHACALLLQFIVYHTFHYSLNYWAWLGRSLRTETGFGMRPAGLYLEPAAFSFMMFSFLALFRLAGGASAALELLGLGTILLSISLWGWAATLVYLLLFRWRWALLLLPVLVGALAYLAITITQYDLKGNIVMWVIIQRILFPGGDTSTHDRYADLLKISQIGDWKLWFGEGIHTQYAFYGSNGLSFLLTAGGAIGAILFGLLWLGYLPRGRRIRGLLSFGFLLTAATQWTFLWWWVWLALMGSASCEEGAPGSESSLPVTRTGKDYIMNVVTACSP